MGLLIDTPVGEWIPAEFVPRFTFIDIEYDPKSDIIREFAIATVHPFVDFPEVDELFSGGGRSIEAEKINRLLDENSLGMWIVGHNIREFDAIKLREIGVSLGDDNLLDTLELSLILDPLKNRHALDGEHRAREDALANISLFWSFDRRWLDVPRKDVEKHLSWQDHASGLGRYLQNIGQRQGHQKKGRMSRPAGRSLARLSSAMSKFLAASGCERLRRRCRRDPAGDAMSATWPAPGNENYNPHLAPNKPTLR